MTAHPRIVAAVAALALVGGGSAIALTSADEVRATCTPDPLVSGQTVVSFDVHCSVPMPAPVTVTQTVTASPTSTTVPPTTTTTPPTSTTTTTVSPPPTTATPPPTTTTAPPAAAHGRDVNASNAGLNRSGLTRAQLTNSAGFTANTAGQVIEGKNITGAVVIRAKNVTIRNSWIQSGAGAQIEVYGDNFTLENTTVVGAQTYQCVWVEGGTGHKIIGDDISGCENLISLNDSGAVLIQSSYLHNAASGGQKHADSIEVYAGKGVQIIGNRIAHPKETETAAINVAPWSLNSSVDGLLVADNYIDGGHMHFVFDKQSTGVMRFIRVLRNDFGGHTTRSVGGSYWAFNVVKGVAGQAKTDAEQAASPTKVLMPETGPDVNHWVDCSDLSPNRTGQVVTWAVGAR